MIKPASLKARFLAFLIDYLIILAYGAILLGVSLAFYNLVFGEIPDLINTIGPFGTQLIGFVTLTLPIMLYFLATESGKHHASVGKRILNIRVASLKTRNVTMSQILIRTVMKFLPWEIAHIFVHQVVYYSQDNGTPPPLWVMIGLSVANILPLIYLGVIIFRKDHRGPYDLAAGTIVTTK